MQGSVVLGGPAAFAQATLNDAPMAAKADIVAQAFLGMKMGCARCHDAPFHPFKQKDLFSLAAMLNGKELKLPATSTVPMVEGGRKPVVTVALKPGESIAPDWPFKDLVSHDETGLLPQTGSLPTRRMVAERIIAPENERFAQVIANRVWKRYMGVGIVEPADDWSRVKPSHPELLEYLGQQFMRSGYDLKYLARLILSSDTYQREPASDLTPQTGSQHRLFAGPARRSMTAEQLVDSLHLAAGKRFDCEDLNLNPAGDRSSTQFLNLGKPTRAWQMTALSNERDRPALALPTAQSAADVMSIFGWRQSRQNPATARDDAPSPMQTLILANGILGTRIVRLSDESYFTEAALKNTTVEQLVSDAFLRILSRPPSATESRTFVELLKPHFADRRNAGARVDQSRPEDRQPRLLVEPPECGSNVDSPRGREEAAHGRAADTASEAGLPRALRRHSLGSGQFARIRDGAVMTRRDLLKNSGFAAGAGIARSIHASTSDADTERQGRRLHLHLAGRRRSPHRYLRPEGSWRRKEEARLLLRRDRHGDHRSQGFGAS